MSEAIQHSPMSFDERGMADYSKDVKIWAEFFTHPVPNPVRSREAGVPQFDNMDYVRIQQRGERDQHVAVATQEHKFRFPNQWAAYLAGKSQRENGTSLALLYPDNLGFVKTLEAVQIYTIESLANASDTALQRIGLGAREGMVKAQQFLETAKTGAPNAQLQAQVEELAARMQTLEQTNAALVKENASLEAELEAASEPRRNRKG